MANRRPPVPPDLQQVLELIRKGKLFALQEWIKSGRRIHEPEIDDSRVHVLRVAVETEFHSVVEELLRAAKWTEEELAEALEYALYRRRPDIADLLLDKGAPLQKLNFETVCHTLDLALMERYLRAGGDPSRDNGFARALSEIKARPLLRFFRQFRAEFPALDDQAALALHQAVDEGQVRWTALLAWAGADPFRPVPWNSEDGFPVDPEYSTNAATRAIWRNNPDILKVLHLKPKAPQALELLYDAASNANIELFRTLLKTLPADQVNNSARGSCTALEQLVKKSVNRNIWTNTQTEKGEAENLQCVELLLDAGARWNPPPEDIRYSRRAIMEHEGRYIVQLLRLLLYTRGAANVTSFLELCRSQTLLSKISAADPPLAEDLKVLRRKNRKFNACDAEAKMDTAASVGDGQHKPS